MRVWRVRATSKIGTDPTIMLTGPVPVTEKILRETGMSIDDIDLFEVNEAFAAVVMRFEHRVRSFFAGREGAFYRVAGTLSLMAILFVGKLLILEVVNFVFGDHVELGHFIEVVALVLALMITRRLFGVLFRSLGVPGEDGSLDGREY